MARCWATFVVLLLPLTILVEFTGGQFLSQPEAGTLFVQLSKPVVLSCLVEQGHVADWRITLVGDVDESREASNTIDLRDILTPRNFTFAGVGSNNSTASFGLLNAEGEEANNATTISCVAQQRFDRVSGNRVQVIFYGTPPPPTDLNITENELGSLNISWSLGFIEGVPVNYTLTVLNLNTVSAQPIIIAGLLDQQYVFETGGPCDVYNLTVTAVTAAGNSTPNFCIWDPMCSISTTSTTSATSATSTNLVVISIVTVLVIVIACSVGIFICICCLCRIYRSRKKDPGAEEEERYEDKQKKEEGKKMDTTGRYVSITDTSLGLQRASTLAHTESVSTAGLPPGLQWASTTESVSTTGLPPDLQRASTLAHTESVSTAGLPPGLQWASTTESVSTAGLPPDLQRASTLAPTESVSTTGTHRPSRFS